jgi:hypothetical protein
MSFFRLPQLLPCGQACPVRWVSRVSLSLFLAWKISYGDAFPLDGPPSMRGTMPAGLDRHDLIGFVGIIVAHFPSPDISACGSCIKRCLGSAKLLSNIGLRCARRLQLKKTPVFFRSPFCPELAHFPFAFNPGRTPSVDGGLRFLEGGRPSRGRHPGGRAALHRTPRGPRRRFSSLRLLPRFGSW